MLTSKCGRLLSVRPSTLHSRNPCFLFSWFVGDEVASEDLEHAFGCSHNGRHVETDVDDARNQPFLSDLMTSQTDGEQRPEDWNRFDDSFREAPAASANDSAFDSAHFVSIKARQPRFWLLC